jgi:nitroreductase
MTRSFSSEPVPGDVLERVLGAATHVPSAGFSQGVDLLVFEGPDETARFHEATSDPGFVADRRAPVGTLAAPVVVLPLTDPGVYESRYGEPDKESSAFAGLTAAQWPVPYWLVDASFTVMVLLLAAADEGLGALFFHLHRDPAPLLAALGVPSGKEVIGAVALGYDTTRGATGSPTRRSRRPSEDVVHRGRW